MTASYWEIERRIVACEQGGENRAGYGEVLIPRLAENLTRRFGRGFGWRNLTQMRNFYLTWPAEAILQTVSAEFDLAALATRFPLPWSAYVRLLSVRDPAARSFYETEALRGGWSVRQLDRQVDSMFYERALLSRNKAAMLEQGALAKPSDRMTPEEAIKDPFVLEFLDLNDQYSESELEAALIQHLADFLLELGDGFTFVGRQRRLRLDDTWFRVDLLLFHRRLKCLVVIDLKVGRFSHADAGQMHLYLNYAREHWMCEGENPRWGSSSAPRKARRKPATPWTTCRTRCSPRNTRWCRPTRNGWPRRWSAPAVNWRPASGPRSRSSLSRPLRNAVPPPGNPSPNRNPDFLL
jgi:predicted nuclease of restriction endonuclease-like (RecB) superfamily